MSTLNPATVSAPPILVDLKQNTPEWHEFRKTHIGASEVPIIMWQSRYSNPYGLYLEKTGQKKGNGENIATSHGHDNEAKAREKYELLTGFFGKPVVFQATGWPEWMLYVDYQFVKPEMLSCSADWYSKGKKRTAEIKCPFEIENHLLAKEGTIPAEYWPQVQENLFVSQAEACDYVSYWKATDDLVVIPVTLDRDYIHAQVIPSVDRFCGWLKNGYPIPEGEQELKDPGDIALAQEAVQAFSNLKRAERQWEQAKGRLAEICFKYKKSHIGPVDVVQTHYKSSHVEFDRAPFIKLEVKRNS